MRNRSPSQSGLSRRRIVAGLAFGTAGLLLAMATWASRPIDQSTAPTNSPGWSIVPSPNTASDRDNHLWDVACASSADCWAVGFYYVDVGHSQTLIQHWDSNAWTIVSSPNASLTGSGFGGVACNSSSDCWAVGAYRSDPSGKNQTLVEHWDGSSWMIVPSPNISIIDGITDNGLRSITCISSADCWAVGSYLSDPHVINGYYHTLIEHWDGVSWAIVPSPNINDRNSLRSVACAAPADCWAIGSFEQSVFPPPGGAVPQTFAEHWNGTSWTIVSTPNVNPAGGFQSNFVNDVTCASPSDCWMVGSYSDTSNNGFTHTLIERWNGTVWAVFPSPSPPRNNDLSAVTCLSQSDCWTVGVYVLSSAYGQTLTEHWDGVAWSIVSSPSTSSTQDNYLYGVACPSASDCWGVGFHATDSFVEQTLALKYAPTVPAVTRVVSKMLQGAGTFAVDLPLTGPPGIECRSGGPASDYQVVFTFAGPVTFNTAAVTGTGTVSGSTGNGTTTVTVDLTGVTNAQTITVTLLGVSNGTSTGDISVQMGILLGDVTGNGAVNASDVSQTQSESGHALSDLNFRADVTANGGINSTDVSTVQAQSGTGLSAKIPPSRKSPR